MYRCSAAWGFGATDNLGGHNGSIVGHFSAPDLPIAPNCGASTSTTLCLDSRFSVSALFRTGPPDSAESQAHTVGCGNPGSGLFWFFNADNWEVMVKAINGCALNNRCWIFSAATTNVFYRLTLYDVHAGAQKIFFNYPGPPAPAVTDTSLRDLSVGSAERPRLCSNRPPGILGVRPSLRRDPGRSATSYKEP